LVAKVSFFPVSNGDSSQIVLVKTDKWLLFDFHHQKRSEEDGSTDFNLKKHLKEQLKTAKRDYYDVLALTHGDDDHIRNSADFFELRHAAKYQGGDRTKVSELWVPASIIRRMVRVHQFVFSERHTAIGDHMARPSEAASSTLS